MATPLYHRWRLGLLLSKLGEGYLADAARLPDEASKLIAAMAVDWVRPGTSLSLDTRRKPAHLRRRQSQRENRILQLKILRSALDPLTGQLYHSIARTALRNAANVKDRNITAEKSFTSNLSVSLYEPAPFGAEP